MKNLFFTITALFFFFAAAAQNVGDRNSQKDVFGSQPTWKQLSSADEFRTLSVSEYVACQTGDKILFWNAVDGGVAEVQEFGPEDQILVLRHGDKEFLYKAGCHNRLKYIRVVKPEPPPAPTPIAKPEKKSKKQPLLRCYCTKDCCCGVVIHHIGHREGWCPIFRAYFW